MTYDMAEQKGVSLRPSDFSAGGFMDDVDVRVLSARFESFDYNGQVSPAVCAIALSMQDVNDEDRTTKQYYSIGPIDKFTPSTDGRRAIATSEGAKVAATSNGAMLINALLTAGFPEDKLNDDIGILDAGVFHVNQVAAPKRNFKEGQGKAKDNATILLPTKIVTLPWEVSAADKKKAAKAAGAVASTSAASKPAGAPATTAPVEGDSDASDAAVEFVLSQITAGGGSVAKNALPAAAFKLKDNPHRNAITQLVAKEAWLSSEDRPWAYANGTISLG